MRRLRLVFLLLAILLLASLGFLVRSGLESAALERDYRHRIVAQRIIDEMERELTALLHREEERPYAHYRYFFVPEVALDLEVSPLAAEPTDPFVVGYFQVEPEGELTSPRWPRNESLAAARTGWSPRTEVRDRIREVEETVEGLWQADPPLDLRHQQTAGSTVALHELEKKKASLESEEAAPFRVLEKLKSGAVERQRRLAKVEPSQASNVYNFSQDVNQNALQQAAVGSGGETDVREGAASREAGRSLDDRGQREVLEQEIERTLETRADATIEIRQEPMVGRPAPGGRLVLYRTVLVGDRAYRQGLVLDVEGLLDWLAGRVLSRPELLARAALVPATSPFSIPEGGYAFRHRFAEPFGSVLGTLVLAPLPEPRATAYFHILSGVVMLAATLGLFALYRMVAVVVGYAERRNNFVSAVTHELKTPLTAIRMYGEMLRDGVVPDGEKRQRYYELLTGESERLTRLLNNVLELSRLEKNTRTMDLVVEEVEPVLEDVVSLLRPHAEREGFALRLEVEPGLPAVRFDRDALSQVLFNLIDNAMKYARDARDREIVLSCRRHDEGIGITVLDRGPGVPRQNVKRIFEPFFRGENELTRRSRGTGIGLALVRGLVERMGGTVGGRNREGGGFEVRILLEHAPSP